MSYMRGHTDTTDSGYCLTFGILMIWFAALTINLGPTFLSGVLVSGSEVVGHLDVCPMVYRPVRHYVFNALWICVNLMCFGLMAVHLRKLYKDINKSSLEAIRVASLMTAMMTVRTNSGVNDHNHREDNHSNVNNFYDQQNKCQKDGIQRVKVFGVILLAYILCFGPLYAITILNPGIIQYLYYIWH